MSWWYLAIPTAVFVAYNIYLEVINRRRAAELRDAFSLRDHLDADAWFSMFADLGVPQPKVEAVLGRVAEIVGCDVTNLRPSDSFDGTLKWRGVAFLGCVEDDNPWDEFVEIDLPRLCGGKLNAGCPPSAALGRWRPTLAHVNGGRRCLAGSRNPNAMVIVGGNASP